MWQIFNIQRATWLPILKRYLHEQCRAQQRVNYSVVLPSQFQANAGSNRLQGQCQCLLSAYWLNTHMCMSRLVIIVRLMLLILIPFKQMSTFRILQDCLLKRQREGGREVHWGMGKWGSRREERLQEKEREREREVSSTHCLSTPTTAYAGHIMARSYLKYIIHELNWKERSWASDLECRCSKQWLNLPHQWQKYLLFIVAAKGKESEDPLSSREKSVYMGILHRTQ